MNWKAEATEKLQKYSAMQMAVKNLPLEFRRLDEEAKALKAVRTDLLPSRAISRREDQLLNNIMCRQELEHELESAKLWIKSTEAALGILLPEERKLLFRLYIRPDPEGIEGLCGQLGVEKSSVYRKREQALRKFTLALYGGEQRN